MLDSGHLRDWLKAGLKAEYPKLAFDLGQTPPERWGDGSGELVLISPTTGPGLNNEHSLDDRAWYIQIFGPPSRDRRVNNANLRAERLANAVDEFILFAPPRPPALYLDGNKITRIQRFGSLATPTALGSASEQDPWSATYVFTVPTKLGSGIA